MPRWSFAIGLVLVASSLRGQTGSPRLQLSLPGEVAVNSGVPTVSLSDILSEGHRREMLTSGWPIALHCRIDLWKKGFIAYATEATVQWDYVVDYAPLTGLYQVRRSRDGRIDTLGTVKTIAEAEEIVDRPMKPAISPQSRGDRYYYVFSVDISTLSMSDLEAWQNWVRGTAAPAVKGKGSILSALKSGFGSVLSRVLGGDKQHYQTPSGVFTAG